ncbi:IDEAL domain-containing protein [Peribacillus muralis]|uniref:IDEAL domain-containing protein n=1 Tax=Peribacillus muralis TaxID=264697 RepID=UPI001F4EC457|nr:IDEAL domain-containing protein [Peribacillus muralis]MCK1993820.1 IDEAL domain-containing protein [Peribacillus muralis]MCK2013891.1 IDEAL domain-containing protein [Peribacillus muralis]
MAGNKQFENGDWVQGRSREGELIHGFIETLSRNQDIIKVNVVESDNEKAIGKAIWIPSKWTEKLPDLEISNESDLLALIDLALLSKDETWFMELSGKLGTIKIHPTIKDKKSDFILEGNRIAKLDF